MAVRPSVGARRRRWSLVAADPASSRADPVVARRGRAFVWGDAVRASRGGGGGGGCFGRRGWRGRRCGRRCGFGVACGRRGTMTAVGGGAGGAQARPCAETAAAAAACEVQARRLVAAGGSAWGRRRGWLLWAMVAWRWCRRTSVRGLWGRR
ncbi:hypothetical protein PVAP13_3NG258237 [Panicum virgatum]|uniref:Uncharacterized protein n=1 Tax=Panicum virgatum TaxID=38727 RepID=A0A8T0U8N7_PANVG|nr:hypothetical protein PVAP13_3NG258237 [Panicum virgatum]